jgi:hypothetical protein
MINPGLSGPPRPTNVWVAKPKTNPTTKMKALKVLFAKSSNAVGNNTHGAKNKNS